MRTCPTDKQEFEDLDAFIFHMNGHYRDEQMAALNKLLHDWSSSEHSAQAKKENAWRIVEAMGVTYTSPKQVIDAYREALRAVMEEPGL